MKLKCLYMFLSLILSTMAYAQPSMDVNSPSDYLMLTTEQQEIYLRRYLKANAELAATCQPQYDLQRSNDYFVRWINHNPQFLRRNLTSAFTAALMDSCKGQ
ncbi:hypothetical protein A8O14_06390 [Polynucleobacter wuianus]|uniref:Rap1a immunity protein domain-containing protein n=1 Tax=Polynucleobacter wuianus TaxID=1743168 RepID=A0A191UFL1_9BURK|nr:MULTISPECIES: hypothetical protein [Polynucleobacter]ANI99737.1 hypothetical protein A8O14_06390 [Polynucleobacter wuianus]MBU3552539.1 hypothetical protein [Polynucleobacter sp. MWH-Post4-6-1]